MVVRGEWALYSIGGAIVLVVILNWKPVKKKKLLKGLCKKDVIVVTQYSDVIMYKKCITPADINVKRQDKCSSIERGNVILAIDL